MKTYDELNDLVDSDPIALRDYAWKLEHDVEEWRGKALDAQAKTDLEGATSPGEYGTWPANAGEFAARWNLYSPKRREEWTRNLVETAQRSVFCMEHDHAQYIAHLEGVVRRQDIELIEAREQITKLRRGR